MSKKILIITGDGGETLEVLYPYERLREAGYTPVVAAQSTDRKIQLVVHDFADDFDTYTEKLAHMWPADVAIDDVDPAEYAGLIIPGGRAPEYLRLNENVLNIVRAFFDADKPVAATCHGPLILARAGVLDGRECAAFGMCEPDVTDAGATYVDAADVTSGNLVTARAWNDNGPWMGAFLKLLG
ncbi:DJ-1/PfpI family protein [Corynebacterium meridianum]|uniref:DJ-1/PfpI family protein n=1 Tax=Corynebacterium meridianum TaxID=2765363 RepID=A0A934I6F3_9CORY|nr:DJ-1/PfpI family protein [Corynebacterium meridianum]MBI8989207.1 DJ-1/PfpI family protein [Corynebacterium meridianum]MCK7676841.1 DJ-1/PfpI family protein [Corynebacterium meridianum]